MEHVPEIVELWKEFEDFHGDLDPFFRRNENGHVVFKDIISDLIQADDTLVVVALDGKRVVGSATGSIKKFSPVYINELYGYIGFMAVCSDCRRKGIGEKMLAEIFDWFKSRDIHRVELRVRVNNQVGYSFWEKHGFKDYEHQLYIDL